MTGDRESELLIEAAVGSWRLRRADGGIGGHLAGADLDAPGRAEVYEAALLHRRSKAAFDKQELSSTAIAVI
jgi:hypothetical protein